ncbi:hypothetical protein SUGI_0237200 [Cryptomeria japonica]|nr:hypothetical protein SUGI_0237200 [Cryptomeria japonica]
MANNNERIFAFSLVFETCIFSLLNFASNSVVRKLRSKEEEKKSKAKYDVQFCGCARSKEEEKKSKRNMMSNMLICQYTFYNSFVQRLPCWIEDANHVNIFLEIFRTGESSQLDYQKIWLTLTLSKNLDAILADRRCARLVKLTTTAKIVATLGEIPHEEEKDAQLKDSNPNENTSEDNKKNLDKALNLILEDSLTALIPIKYNMMKS